MERLVELHNNVRDSYYGFVVGVINYTKRGDSNRTDMINYIENNPTALSAGIIDYMISRKDYYDHAQHIVGVMSAQSQG